MNYPIILNLDGKEITIIGGGNIAYRKSKNFIDFGYSVKVVSLEFNEKFKVIEDKITLIRDEYKEKYIENSFIVVAATNNKNKLWFDTSYITSFSMNSINKTFFF